MCGETIQVIHLLIDEWEKKETTAYPTILLE